MNFHCHKKRAGRHRFQSGPIADVPQRPHQSSGCTAPLKILSLCLILLLTCCANVNAMFVAGSVNSAEHFTFSENHNSLEIQKTPDHQLLTIGKQIRKPYISFTASVASRHNYTKSLPALPATILLVMVGFFCVSFVKDRRFWIALSACLLWAALAGVQSVPKLAKQISSRSHNVRNFSPQTAGFHQTEQTNKTNPYIPLTTYTAQTGIIIPFTLLFSANIRLTVTAEHIVCFTPAFIFTIKPRAPPLQA